MLYLGILLIIPLLPLGFDDDGKQQALVWDIYCNAGCSILGGDEIGDFCVELFGDGGKLSHFLLPL